MNSPPHADLESRLARVRLLLLDVDGVLTDGSITYTSDGGEAKTFHVRDGVGLRLWREAGNMAAIITGRSSAAVERRAAELGIAVVRQGVGEKGAVAEEVLRVCGVGWDETAAIGDDVPDIPLAARALVGFAVADACAELRDAAAIVTTAPGGRGAVREAVERLLRARGGWEPALERYRGGVA
jgi:3-deoxy-D-manno-octulosonate 8-phosphate phosphatase (KDO 8-P phosphatase)